MQAAKLNPIEGVQAFIAIVRALIALVQEVEVPGFGPAKKEAVLGLLAAIYDTTESWHVIPKEVALGFSSTAIDLIVAFFNLIGRFKRSIPADPAEPPAEKSQPRDDERHREVERRQAGEFD